VHHVGILYGQFMMHGQRNIKLAYRYYPINLIISKRFHRWKFRRL